MIDGADFYRRWSGRVNYVPGQAADSIDLVVPVYCWKCKRLLVTCKFPVADVRTGKGYCDLLCYALDLQRIGRLALGVLT